MYKMDINKKYLIIILYMIYHNKLICMLKILLKLILKGKIHILSRIILKVQVKQHIIYGNGPKLCYS